MIPFPPTHYSKSSEYLPGEEMVDNRYRNSWNAVFVAGGWRLVQANWGMLSVNNKMARETRQIYQGQHGTKNRIERTNIFKRILTVALHK